MVKSKINIGEDTMKKIGKLLIALILIYIILVGSVADINHGEGPITDLGILMKEGII